MSVTLCVGVNGGVTDGGVGGHGLRQGPVGWGLGGSSGRAARVAGVGGGPSCRLQTWEARWPGWGCQGLHPQNAWSPVTQALSFSRTDSLLPFLSAAFAGKPVCKYFSLNSFISFSLLASLASAVEVVRVTAVFVKSGGREKGSVVLGRALGMGVPCVLRRIWPPAAFSPSPSRGGVTVNIVVLQWLDIGLLFPSLASDVGRKLHLPVDVVFYIGPPPRALPF